jgi:hypothetical protein
MGAAIGAGTFFGIKLEEPSDVYSVGHPIPAGLAAVIAAPVAAATTAGSAGAGNITGTVEHRYAYIMPGGFLSTPSAWSTALPLTAKNAELTDVLVCPTATCIGRVIERRVGSVRCVVGYIWNNTATIFTDSLSLTSASLDFSNRLPEIGETGANGEFKYPYVESGDTSVEPKTVIANVITGGAGEPLGRPGPVGIAPTVKGTANPGELVHYLLTMGLDCTKYGRKSAAWDTDLTDVDEPTRKYVFTPKAAGIFGKGSLSIHNHGGGASVNGFIWQAKASEAVVKTAQGKVVEAETKMIACGYTPHGLPAATLDAGAPTSLVLPVLFGRRSDAARATASTYVKVTTGPSAGTMGVKAKDASAATYNVAGEQTLVYNNTTKKMSQQTGMFSDKLRLLDQTGAQMGYGSGRPLMFAAGGSVELFEANDEFVFPPKPRIPGAGSTPGTDDGTYTGFTPKRIASPDFTEANATVTDGSTGLLVTATQIKLTDPKKLIEGHGVEAGYGYDVQDSGKKGVELQFTRYFEDLTYQERQELLVRNGWTWKLEGDLILITPGTFSTQRETIQVDISLGEIQSAKPTVGGADIRMETVTVAAKEPTDGSAAFTITVITREDVPIPA